MAARGEISVRDIDAGPVLEKAACSLVGVCGLLNKQVGYGLGISEITVKSHRGQMMQKMDAGYVADLVNIAGKPGIARRRWGLHDR